MSKELSAIKARLEQSPVIKNIFGKDSEKYILNILSEISKTMGDAKKDLTKCTPDSLVAAIKQASDLKLEIDGRQHCHLIKYGNTANLQIGYRGFIYSIKRAYPDANIDCRLVYEGDDFTVKKEGDVTTYKLDINNPFAPKDKIIGGFCYISYSLGDTRVSFCETMSIQEINKIKGCAKQDFIWKQWFEEKAKVAIIKRACKIHFSGINEQIAEIADFDNQEFDMNKMPVIGESSEEGAHIEPEQAFRIKELAEKAGKSVEGICEIYNIENILQLPLDKFSKLESNLHNVNP